MSIGSRIKEARVRIGITQEQLANLINVSKGAIGNYENDTNYPKTEVIFDLCRVLKCDANYLYQDDVASASGFCVSYPEQGFLRRYRSLDEHGKETVDAVLILEYKRCQSEFENIQEIIHYLSIPVYDDPAAAGSPSDNSSDSDSKDRGFESRRARQKPVKIAVLTGFLLSFGGFLHFIFRVYPFVLSDLLFISACFRLLLCIRGTKWGTICAPNSSPIRQKTEKYFAKSRFAY